MKTGRLIYLGIVATWSILLMLAIYEDIGFLRVMLGLPFALLLPGYLLLKALSIKGLSGKQEFTLSCGASIIVIGMMGLALNLTPLGLKTDSVFLCLTILVISFAAIASPHKSPNLIQGKDSLVKFINSWKQIEKSRKFIFLFLLLFVVGIISMIVWRLNTIQSGERFSEFYLLSANHLAGGASLQLEAGKRNEVILGVFNHEQEDTIYSFDIQISEGTIYSSEPFVVKVGENFENNTSFNIPSNMVNQEIVFRLFKAGNNFPYRTLHAREGNFEPTPNY